MMAYINGVRLAPTLTLTLTLILLAYGNTVKAGYEPRAIAIYRVNEPRAVATGLMSLGL